MSLAAVASRLRAALVEEATPLPGQQLAYGRPHAHPRSRYFPRYSPTGERMAGVVRIGPDCPRPVKGRCECPPDGSWRPSVGVIRADATAAHAAMVPASRLRPALEGSLWVAEVYELDPDGLWRCRWPARRALERQRGADPAMWAVAVRLLRGQPVAVVWGAHGAPPDPVSAAVRLLERIERWADEERVTEWERRPRQWWDRPRPPNGCSTTMSESQAIAEAGGTGGLDGAATMSPTGRVRPLPRSTASDAAPIEQPSGLSGARRPSGIPFPDSLEGLCA